MTIPCDQKETIVKLTEDLESIKIRQAEIHGSVEHIKHRIDNGMGKTIYEIYQKLELFCADSMRDRAIIHEQMKDHKWWINAVRIFIVTIAGVAITGGLVTLYQRLP